MNETVIEWLRSYEGIEWSRGHHHRMASGSFGCDFTRGVFAEIKVDITSRTDFNAFKCRLATFIGPLAAPPEYV